MEATVYELEPAARSCQSCQQGHVSIEATVYELKPVARTAT